MGCVQTQNTQPQVIEAQQPPRQVRTLGGKRHPREPLPPSKRPPDDDPRAWWEDETCQFDQELERELFAQREDKTGNTVRRHERSPKRPGNNHGMFTYESPIKGDQALAVKSWMGAVRQPDFPPPVNKSAPEVDLRLEYVYGYRCFDVRQNIFFTSGTHEIVYMAAALGIVLNTYYNSQRFFGAGAQTRTPSHSDDITALAIHPDRSLVATGEVGKNPKIIIWDTASMRVTREFLQGSDSRAVTSLAFSSDGRYLAAVADDNEHTVRVWDWQTDIKIWDQRGGGDKILGICWSWEGSMKFCTVGIRHICFWDGNQSFSKRKGIFGKGGRICNMTSVQYLPNGNAITGGTNGFLYIWQGNQCIKSVVVHAHNSAIHTLRVIGDEVFSGGADKKLNVLSTDLYMKKSYDMPATPRAVDSYKGQTVVGCRNGGIYLIEARGPRSVMESHCDGEVWGLGVSPSGDNLIATSGDDNQIKVWDTYRRKCVASAVLELRPQAKRRPGEGASTLAASSPNQQSRALAISAHSGHVAVGYNDGHFTVRRSLLEIDVVLHTGQNSKEWIEVMRYSPDGKWLAIGSHDNTIYIYRTDNYRFVSRNSRHHSYIIAIDWSLDSKSLKTTSGDYELLFWTLDPTGEIHHAPDGSSVNKNEQWHTYSTHFGWHVQGIYRGITDYTHVNRVDRSLDGMFFAVGNDWGLVELFNNPNDETSSFKGFRGHSEHVTNVKWG